MGSVATLSGSLLVRKGEARPAVLSAVPAQRFDLATTGGGARPRPRLARAGGGPPGGPAPHPVAMTLRLDGERHRRLRLFAACTERSMQSILVAALDAYIARACADDDHGCACLRDGVPSPTCPGGASDHA